MNFGVVCKVIGNLLLVESLFLAVPLLVSVLYAETAASAFAWSLVSTAVIGFLLSQIKPKTTTIKAREGLLIVTLGWIAASICGALPFTFSGSVPTFIDALFETVSGLTTTGATIMDDVEILPKGILFWRSFTHWLGGMGILVFTLAVLPAIGVGGMQIYKAEAAGPTADKLVPRLANTAKLLYTVYLGITVTGIAVLLIAGVTPFESVVLGLGTVGTGGFFIYNDSIGVFNQDSHIVWILTTLMIVSGINFALYYELWQRRWQSVRVNSELKLYLTIVLVSGLLITANLMYAVPGGAGFWENAKHAFFQVASIITTTGYTTVDFNQWPEFSKTILFALIFVGGSAGSTAGGIKVIRLLVAGKLLRRETSHMLHSRALVPITVNGRVISNDTAVAIVSFILLYITVFGLGALVLTLAGTDLVTSTSAVATALSNVGIGFGLVGPMRSFSFFSGPIKLFLVALMLFGRLELFTILVIFTPGFWKQ